MPAPQYVPAAPSVPGEKHYILYAQQNLREFRFFLILAFVAYLGYAVFSGVTHGNQASYYLIGAAYSLFPLFLYLALWLYSKLTYSVIDAEGIEVRFPIRRAKVPFAEIEKARIDTMAHLFDRPERARMRTRTVQHLGPRHALCLRLRDDEDDLPAILRRKLGPRMVLDRELVLPITNADGAFLTVKARLGSRREAPAEPGLSGRRRRKKVRR